METLKDFVRPPFATYDIVVYFGCGLFALPFIFHYLGGLDARALQFDFGFKPQIVAGLVSALTVLFSVYILGHIIAYAGSQLVEKTMDAWFGKTSAVILACCNAPGEDVGTALRTRVGKRFSKSLRKEAWLSGWVRLAFHFPVLFAYLVIAWLKLFGYFRTRVSKEVIEAAETKLAVSAVSNLTIAEGNHWFKPIEAIVINSNPAATARMYNYLVIAGLFRSVCTIIMWALWWEFTFLLVRFFGIPCEDGLLMLGAHTFVAQVFSYALLTTVYLFSLFSYLKFQRRYVEEAIYSFVFSPGD